MNDNSSDDHQPGYGDTVANNWLNWFTTLDGHQYMIKVDEEYIRDPFNLHGLQQQLGKDKFKRCLEAILSDTAPNDIKL